MRYLSFLLIVATTLTLGGCLRVQVATPKDPIVININVKIEHEIYIKADKDVEELLREHSDLF